MLRNVSVAIHWGKKEKVREEWGEEGRRKTEHSFEKKKKTEWSVKDFCCCCIFTCFLNLNPNYKI